jgi:hypothetical protein
MADTTVNSGNAADQITRLDELFKDLTKNMSLLALTLAKATNNVKGQSKALNQNIAARQKAQPKSTDVIRQLLGFPTSKQEKAIHDKIQQLHGKSMYDGSRAALDIYNSRKKAITKLKDLEIRNAVERQVAIGDIYEKGGGLLKKKGIELADTIGASAAGGILETLGVDLVAFFTGPVGMTVAAIVAGGEALGAVAGYLANDLINTAAATTAAGMTFNETGFSISGMARSSMAMREVAGRNMYAFKDLHEQMSIAAKEGGLAFTNLADSGKYFTDEMNASVMKNVSRVTINVARIGQLMGMSADAAVQMQFHMARNFGSAISGMDANMAVMAGELNRTRIPLGEFNQIFTEVGDSARFTNMGFDQANAGIMSFYQGIKTFAAQANLGSEAAAKLSRNVGQIMGDAFRAFSNISPEQIMAYTVKPGQRFGEAYVDALSMNAFEKVSDTMDTLRPLATKGAASQKEAIGNLIALWPQLKSIGGAEAVDIAGILLAPGNEAKWKSWKSMPKDMQAEEFKKMAPNLDRQAMEIFVAGDVNKAILNSVDNLGHAFADWALAWVTQSGKSVKLSQEANVNLKKLSSGGMAEQANAVKGEHYKHGTRWGG